MFIIFANYLLLVKLKYLMKIKTFIPFCFLFIGTLALPQPSLAEEKIEVIPIIQSSKGLSGKKFNYLEGKPELRLLKVKIPVGLKTPIHTHPSPMLIHVTRGRLKHVRGEEINFFKAGDAFIESNNGAPPLCEKCWKEAGNTSCGSCISS